MTKVPGEPVWSHGEGTGAVTIYWRAHDSLVAGRTYRVLDVPSSVDGETEFVASPAVTWATTDELAVRTRAETNITIASGDISCTSRYTVRRCSLNDPPSPSEVNLYTLERTVMWFSAEVGAEAGQAPPLKQKVVYWRDGDAPADLAAEEWKLDIGQQRFDDQAERYCYRVAVHNLLDASEREWEGCREHGDLPALEAHERDDEAIARETQKCSEPPEGLEQAWCEQFLIACQDESTPSQVDCEEVSRRCSEQPKAAPPPPAAGCSVHQAPTTPPLTLPLTAAFALLALRRRKKH